MSLTPAEADRGTRDASIVLALTLPTDTVLYLLLPLLMIVLPQSMPFVLQLFEEAYNTMGRMVQVLAGG